MNDGTIIAAKDQSQLVIKGKKLWTIDEFCKII